MLPGKNFENEADTFMEAGALLRRIYGVLFGRPMNVSCVDAFVCGSARIMSRREFEWILKREGVRSILSLTETPLASEWTKQLDSYKNIQVPNHEAPTVAQLEESVMFLEENVARKTKVVVHCAAGKGRTGTVLAAYLCEKDGLSPKEAIARVRSQRPGSVEKDSGQEESIYAYAKLLESQNQKKRNEP